MKIISLNVGFPATQLYFGKDIFTGGRKTPVPYARLYATNFDGDGQADLKNHGGPDKAVCVYPFDHYTHWEQVLGHPLTHGAFSENLTTSGLLETEVCIGDVFDIGEAQLQVSQPRQPCDKLAGKNDQKDLPKLIHANGYSGFYFRVLRPGLIRAGDPITLVARDPAGVTIQFINELLYKHRTNRADFERALALEALSEAGKRSLRKRMGT